MFRFTMINHMCRDMEQLADTTRPPDRIRQDVARSPGGDSRIFLNNCIGCHSGMDPMAQAFAYYNFDETQGKLVYTPGVVQREVLHQHRQLQAGVHHAQRRTGKTAGVVATTPCYGFEWRAAAATARARSRWARRSANSDEFAQCQVEKAFKAVCFRAPSQRFSRS